MGYYIETSSLHGKAEEIARVHGGEIVPKPDAFSVAPDTALVCVVDNGFFEAAGICYDEQEFTAFNDPSDPRPRKWLTIPKAVAIEACPPVADRFA